MAALDVLRNAVEPERKPARKQPSPPKTTGRLFTTKEG